MHALAWHMLPRAGTVRNLRGVPLIVLAAHLLEAGLHPWVLLQPAGQGPPTTALKYAGSAWAVCCDSQLKRAEQNRFHIVVHIHANRLYPEFCSLCRSYLTQPCSSLASTLLQSPNCTCPFTYLRRSSVGWKIFLAALHTNIRSSPQACLAHLRHRSCRAACQSMDSCPISRRTHQPVP